MIYNIRNYPEKGQRKVCITRYGAWGDAIILSPVFKYYKQQRWHVTVNCTQKCYDVLRTNPNIDAFLLQADGEIQFTDLNEYWKKLKIPFDKFLNFSGSIENTLLLSPSQEEYWLSKDEIHKLCNKNYYDHTMEVAGFPDKKGETGELYFKKREEDWAKAVKNRYDGFVVLWCLTGSSIHKIYPYADVVIQSIVDGIPNAHVILVGEAGAGNIIDNHPRILDWCGKIGIRKSFVLTKYLDLVVSTETSVLAAAGCFDTPKLALLSHGSHENLTKYYRNCTVVTQNVSCYPCHKLHYTRDTCIVVPETQFPICMGLLHPKKLLPPIEDAYKKWQQTKILGVK